MSNNAPQSKPNFLNINDIEDYINNHTEDFFTKCCEELFDKVLIIYDQYFYLEEKVILDFKKYNKTKGIITNKIVNDLEYDINYNNTALEVLSAINYFRDNLYTAIDIWLQFLKKENIITSNIYILMPKILDVLDIKNSSELKSYIKNKYTNYKKQLLALEILKKLNIHINDFWHIFNPEIMPEEENPSNNSTENNTNNIAKNNNTEKSDKSKIEENINQKANIEYKSNANSGLLIDQINSQIEIFKEIDKNFIDNSNLMPSDNNQILNTLEDVKYLLKALKFLGEVIVPEFYEEAVKEIYKKEKEIKNTKNNKLIKERILIDCKIYLLHLINLIGLQEKTLNDAKFILDTSDISKFLDSIKYYFPEFKVKLPSQNKVKPVNKIITNNLFKEKNLEAIPTSIIVGEVFNFCIGNKYQRHQDIDEFVTKTINNSGTIEFILTQVKEEFKNQLIKTEGVDTYKIFSILITQSLKEISKPDEKITLSGNDIISLLNREDMRDNTGNKRLGKQYTLDWVSEHIKIIQRLAVFIGKYSPSGKKSFSLSQTNLINILEINGVYPLNENGFYDRKKPLLDYHVTFSIGEWLKYFNDSSGQYLNQFGYIHKEVLGLNTRNRWAEKIGLWLPKKLEESRNNPNRGFKIKTIFEGIHEYQKVELILSEPNSSKKAVMAKNIKHELETAFTSLKSLEKNPYILEYKEPPSWVINPKERKPRGWFNIWLEVVVIIKNPLCLTAKAVDVKGKPIKEKDLLTVENLKKAMTENKVGIRPLADTYGVSFSWLQRKLKSGNFTKTELKDLLSKVNFLGGN